MQWISKSFFIILVLFFLISPVLSAEESGPGGEYKLYTKALEELLAENIPDALEHFQQLLAEYPDTELREKAEMYINLYGNKRDRSGGIAFYTGWLLTGIFVAEGIPLLFEINNVLILSGTGILGIGAGLGAAWFQARDRNMSIGQDNWIEIIQLGAMFNVIMLLTTIEDLFFDTSEDEALAQIWLKIDIGLEMATAVASRLLTYNYVKDRLPSPGRVGFVTNAYAWAHAYYWATIMGIFESANIPVNHLLGMVIPDALAVGAALYWDKLNWSFTRSGIITVGGLGGLLIGVFLNMAITELQPEFPSQAVVGIEMACALGGKALTVYLTRNMDAEVRQDDLLKTSNLAIVPVVSADGIGFRGQFSF